MIETFVIEEARKSTKPLWVSFVSHHLRPIYCRHPPVHTYLCEELGRSRCAPRSRLGASSAAALGLAVDHPYNVGVEASHEAGTNNLDGEPSKST